jgi:phosphatidylglycerol:prolipoprotein diacylglycerol transferase
MHPYINIGSHTLYSFGLSAGLGVTLSLLAFVRYFRARQIHIKWIPFVGLLLPLGAIGAHFSYCIDHPDGRSGLMWVMRVVDLTSGGFSYIGALFTVLVAGIVLISIQRLPLFPTMDSVYCVSLGYSFAKVGCFLAGDGDYGVSTNSWWGISFPHGLIPTVQRVQPTMLFLAGWELLLFAGFWIAITYTRVTFRRPGLVFGVYLFATSLGRYLIEYLSLNRRAFWGMTEAQCGSLILAVIGGTVILLRLNEQKAVALCSGTNSLLHSSSSSTPHSCSSDQRGNDLSGYRNR